MAIVPKVFYFDLGDTLVHIRPDILTEAARRISSMSQQPTSVTEFTGAVAAEWRQRNQRNGRGHQGEDSSWVNTEEIEAKYWCGFYHAVLGRLNLRTPSLDLLNYLAAMQSNPESFALFPDVIPTLQALRAREAHGIRLGIISNAFPSAELILKKFDLDQYFTHRILSYKEGCSKPGPTIYYRAIQEANCRHSQIVFVDDRTSFVEKARSVGMYAFLLDRKREFNKWRGDRLYDLYGLLKIADMTLSARLSWSWKQVSETVFFPSQYKETPVWLERLRKVSPRRLTNRWLNMPNKDIDPQVSRMESAIQLPR